MPRREDLEDMLVDPAYFGAIFHTISEVKELYQSQVELGLANETIASALTRSVLAHWSLSVLYGDIRSESRTSG